MKMLSFFQFLLLYEEVRDQQALNNGSKPEKFINIEAQQNSSILVKKVCTGLLRPWRAYTFTCLNFDFFVYKCYICYAG